MPGRRGLVEQQSGPIARFDGLARELAPRTRSIAHGIRHRVEGVAEPDTVVDRLDVGFVAISDFKGRVPRLVQGKPALLYESHPAGAPQLALAVSVVHGDGHQASLAGDGDRTGTAHDRPSGRHLLHPFGGARPRLPEPDGRPPSRDFNGRERVTARRGAGERVIGGKSDWAYPIQPMTFPMTHHNAPNPKAYPSPLKLGGGRTGMHPRGEFIDWLARAELKAKAHIVHRCR